MIAAPITVAPNDAPLAIAMTAAPRPRPRVERSVAQLRQAGFAETIHLFAEPATVVASAAGVVPHVNARRLGVWLNWRSAAGVMLQTTSAPWILLCQDDIDVAPCAALALRHAMATLPKDTWGYASLYTSRGNVAGQKARPGWQALDLGRAAVGAQGYCFTRESLAAVLSYDRVLRYRLNHGIDAVVSQALQEMGRNCYFHLPSLCAHTGEGNSTKGVFAFTGKPGPAGLAVVGFSPDYRGYVANRAPNTPVSV